jgi:Glycosyl transferase family 2
MQCPTVSVLIPTYNRAEYLLESLLSVFGQSVPPSQVIVINDGSADNTREVLKPYMGRIEYLEKENGGKSAALNLALPLVRGEYVWIMDDDDVALPDALETHLSVLESDPSIGFTWTARFLAKNRPEGGGLEIIEQLRVHQFREGELFLDLLETNLIGCHSVMVRRSSCLAEVGEFDPELIRSQDYDMALRIAQRFRGKGIDKPTILYRLHSGVRGSAAASFSPTQNALMWRQYAQKTFRRLREELQLSDYLPADLRARPLGGHEIRRACLKRMTVMAARGMINEMVDDLQLAIASPAGGIPLSAAERGMIIRSLNYLWPQDITDFRRKLATRKIWTSREGMEIRVEMTRTLYWRAEQEIRARCFSRVLDMLRIGKSILGLRGIPHALQTKFSRPERELPSESGAFLG